MRHVWQPVGAGRYPIARPPISAPSETDHCRIKCNSERETEHLGRHELPKGKCGEDGDHDRRRAVEDAAGPWQSFDQCGLVVTAATRRQPARPKTSMPAPPAGTAKAALHASFVLRYYSGGRSVPTAAHARWLANHPQPRMGGLTSIRRPRAPRHSARHAPARSSR